jgi:hypothetical protein
MTAVLIGAAMALGGSATAHAEVAAPPPATTKPADPPPTPTPPTAPVPPPADGADDDVRFGDDVRGEGRHRCGPDGARGCGDHGDHHGDDDGHHHGEGGKGHGRGDGGGHGGHGGKGEHGHGHDGHGKKHDDDKQDDKKDDDKKGVQIGGRVVAREQLASENGDPWTSKLGLEDARLEVTYAHGKRVEFEIEIGATADAFSLKNAFADVRLTKDFRLRAGRFRMPFSAHALTSSWKLPTVDRGLLNDVLDDGMGVTGRRNGAQVRWEADGDHKPSVALAMFQGMTGGGSNKGLLVDDQGAVDVVLRGEVDALPDRLQLGVSGSSRVALKNAIDGRSRYWAAGLDAQLEAPVAGGTARAWADAVVGTTHLDATPMTTKVPMFTAGRLVAAWRCGGAEDGERFVEPYLTGAVTDVNLDNADDLMLEVGAGANVGRWDEWRAQLQVDYRAIGELVPAAIDGGISAPDDRLAITLQLGAAF